MKKNIQEIRHDVIPLQEGVRLAYRAWMPVDAGQQPVPAILEYLPYRKSDGTVVRDEITLPATAAHGYACIRVDIRGTGESEGLFDDEYSEQELSDAEQVIDWISRQHWCNGQVGMVGISWGGFNALQLAFRQPPALKAVITLCSTDDRFNEDVHFAGGCLLNDNLDWAAFFWAYAQARCPDPRLVGSDWKKQWLERLEYMPFLPARWLAEQAKSRYWKHGSVSEDYSRITLPVYAIGGWADAYRNTVFRLVENLSAPCKGLVGPWAHAYPHIACPNPKIDYVRESVRWWDKWLKGIENNIMDEPKLQYYLMDSVKPAVDYAHREGSWQSAVAWPPASMRHRQYFLHPGSLLTEPNDKPHTLEVNSPETTGRMGGKLMVGIGFSGEFPNDQQADDRQSRTFDTPVLGEILDIVGQPRVNLALCSDQPVSNVIVRLCDVHPAGESTLVTYGVLNLAHRESNENPEALVPGQTYRVDIALNHIAYRLPRGHRLRLAVSNAYWPLIWPSPFKDRLYLELSECRLSLPCPASVIENTNPALSDHDPDKLPASLELRPGHTRKTTREDPETGELKIRTETDYGYHWHRSCDTGVDFTINQLLSIHPDEPNSAKSEATLRVKMQQGDTETALRSHYKMTSSSQHYFIRATWQAWEGENCIFEQQFNEKIERNLI
ncbi:MAG: CocE/NonD family hydrolase [Gammaproteobacteria bacterium]|nr:CocE/NonD family hydrolase [Gammaproteobacteria bacterium]